MAWSINSSQNSPSAVTSNVTSATLTAPTGIANGHLLVAMVAVDIPTGGDPGAISLANAGTGAAWNNLTGHYTPAGFQGSIRLHTFWKIASGESGNYTATWTTAGRVGWGIVDITGNAANSPVDVAATSSSPSATGTSFAAPALTGLTGSSDLLLCMWANPGGGSPYTVPAGMSTVFNNNQANADCVWVGMTYQALTSNAATSSQTATATGGNVTEMVSVAFLASGGGGGGGSPAIGSDSVAARSGAMQVIMFMRDRLIEPARSILRPRPQFATW
jgi:hypothetical protein